MLTKGKIANFTGGISQQAPALRLPTQSDLELNCFPMIVDGLRKRPPSEHCGVGALAGSSAFTHFILRDETERYILSIQGGQIAVTDLAGNPHSVSTPNGTGYLGTGGTDANRAFNAVSVADYTFVTNRTVSTAKKGGHTAPSRPPEALVNVAQGNYGKTYTVTINGVVRASYTTPQGATERESTFVDTTFIARLLYTAMTGMAPPPGTFDPNFTPNATHTVFTDPQSSSSIGAQYGTGDLGTYYGTGDLTPANGWSVEVIGNALYVSSMTGVDFSVSVADGYNGNALKVCKGTTQFFTDLPQFGPDGFVASITGDQGNNAQVYYVRFTKQNTADSSGVWKECPKPGLNIGPDPALMPHILVRNSNGSFTFKEASWNDKVCGDDVTNPDPSFLGQPIDNMTLHQNRLGFLSVDNFILSKSGDFFNFYRTTATEIVDNDPIDVNAATQSVSLFRAAAPYQQSLILFSDLTQFAFSGNELLTQKTVNMNVVTSYTSLVNDAQPVATPRRIFFPVDRGNYVGIREWYYDVFYRIGNADDDTAHVPGLIPAGVFKMANSTIEDCLFVATSGDPGAIYVYKYVWQGQEKLQSAWTRWSFDGATVLNFEVVDSSLYVVLNRGGQTFIEGLRIAPGLTDNGQPLTYLDRRIGSEKLPAPVYNATDDVTVYALPYGPDAATLRAVTRADGVNAQFLVCPVRVVDGVHVTLAGDTRGLSLYFGHLYEQRIKLSPIFARDADKGAVQEGRLQLLKMDLSYSETGYFRAQVTPVGRGAQVYEFNPWEGGSYLGAGSAVQDGTFTFPVMSRADNVDIELINDGFLPATFIRAEWKANFVPKARK